MGQIDSTDFDKICSTSELARLMTRSVVTETVDSSWGTVTASTTTDTASVPIIFIPVNEKDIQELQGVVKSGDARGYCKAAQTMTNDNLLVDASLGTYRVENLRSINAGTNIVFKKFLLKKI